MVGQIQTVQVKVGEVILCPCSFLLRKVLLQTGKVKIILCIF